MEGSLRSSDSRVERVGEKGSMGCHGMADVAGTTTATAAISRVGIRRMMGEVVMHQGDPDWIDDDVKVVRSVM